MSKAQFNTINQTDFNRIANYKAMSDHFLMLSANLVQNKELSFFEVGIMTYLLSMSDEWVVNSTQVQKASGAGRTAFDKAWKHLQTLGYIKKNPISGGGWHWIVNELPNLDIMKLSDNHRMSDFRQAEKEQLISIKGELDTETNRTVSASPAQSVSVEKLDDEKDFGFFSDKSFNELMENTRCNECEEILSYINKLNNDHYEEKRFHMNQEDHYLILRGLEDNTVVGLKESIDAVFGLVKKDIKYFAPSYALKSFKNKHIYIPAVGESLNDLYNVVYEDDLKQLQIRKRL